MEKQERFNGIFEQHYPKVLRLCLGYFKGDADVADDAAQEVFMKVWQHLDAFRGESSISTWIYRITVNTCLVFIRKRKAKKEVLTDQLPAIAAEHYSPEKEEKFARMYACIGNLDALNRMMILMVLEGAGYDKIAEVVGMTEENVRVRIHRIKKNLTQCVQS